jgi:hypothetical protein
LARHSILEDLQIACDLIVQCFASFGGDVPVVAPIHKALDLHRDQQADGDSDQVQEKLADSMEALVQGMYIEHRGVPSGTWA